MEHARLSRPGNQAQHTRSPSPRPGQADQNPSVAQSKANCTSRRCALPTDHAPWSPRRHHLRVRWTFLLLPGFGDTRPLLRGRSWLWSSRTVRTRSPLQVAGNFHVAVGASALDAGMGSGAGAGLMYQFSIADMVLAHVRTPESARADSARPCAALRACAAPVRSCMSTELLLCQWADQPSVFVPESGGVACAIQASFNATHTIHHLAFGPAYPGALERACCLICTNRAPSHPQPYQHARLRARSTLSFLKAAEQGRRGERAARGGTVIRFAYIGRPDEPVGQIFAACRPR